MNRNIWTPTKSFPDQSFLLQPLPEAAVFRQDITQQEVILLLLCGKQTHDSVSRLLPLGSDARVVRSSRRMTWDAPTGPVELVLMTLQKSVSGCSRKRLRQYNVYLREER